MAIGNRIVGNRFRSIPDYLKAIEDVSDRVSELTKIFQDVRRAIAGQVFEIGPSGIDPKNSPEAAPVGVLKKLVPNMKKLQREFDVVTGLHAAMEELDLIEADLQVKFNLTGSQDLVGAAQKAAKMINTVRNKTRNELATAYRFLNQLGSSSVPKDVQEFVEVLAKAVSNVIEYKSVEPFLYVIPHEETFMFVHYLHLKELRDDSGKFYPELNVVTSAKLMPQGKEYRLTLLNKFSAPGSFPFGKRVSNVKDAVKVLGVLLDLENFDNQFNRVPLANILNQTQLQKKMFTIDTMVKEVKAEEDTIHFTFKTAVKNREHAQRLAGQLHAQLQPYVRRTNARMRQRLGEHPNNKGYYVEFYFVREPHQGVTAKDLEFLRDRFRLSTQTVDRIVHDINND